jgi:hypothetical protein
LGVAYFHLCLLPISTTLTSALLSSSVLEAEKLFGAQLSAAFFLLRPSSGGSQRNFAFASAQVLAEG